MSLDRIVAHLTCDHCGSEFTAHPPSDASSDDCATIFEIVRLHGLDQAKMKESHEYGEAGYHDGEFFGPCCWPTKSEEMFVAEIREGRISEKELSEWGLLDLYAKYLPRPQLESSS